MVGDLLAISINALGNSAAVPPDLLALPVVLIPVMAPCARLCTCHTKGVVYDIWQAQGLISEPAPGREQSTISGFAGAPAASAAPLVPGRLTRKDTVSPALALSPKDVDGQ
jgi:hypothetical protein